MRIDPGALAERIPARPVRDSAYRTAWLDAETRVRRAIDREMTACARLFEPKVAWLIARSVPAQTPVFISNSMPVRDVESFWLPSNARTIAYANRGANGIDGIVSTALGVAHRGAPSVLLIGDLAFLHDQTGLLIAPSLAGHLTIVVVDNNGGGIFQNLPIAELDPPFERFFATPQAVDLGLLCRAHGVAHRQIGSWTELEIELRTLPAHGVRVLVVPTDRRADAIERRALWARLAVEAGA
ncbi:MAG: hypothetical protein ACREQ5_38780 [Candidatus Dormibacteria bacterium]